MNIYKWVFWLFVGFILLKSARRSEIVEITNYDYGTTRVDSFLTILKKIPGLENETVVLAQAYLETGDFKSDICKKNKNHFGMKWNDRGFAKGVRNNHAYYEYEADSYYDYAAWQKKATRGRVMTDEEYLSLLEDLPFNCGKTITGKRKKCRYATDRGYITKLKLIIAKIKQCQTVGAL